MYFNNNALILSLNAESDKHTIEQNNDIQIQKSKETKYVPTNTV